MSKLTRPDRCGCGRAATHRVKSVPSCDRCTAWDISSGLYGDHVHRNGQSAQTIYRWDDAPSCLEPKIETPSHVLEMFALVEARVMSA
jgi:hypothetical protein